ncbi:D-alanine--D-alanine ligase [Balneolaceae bacterium YR4-1]|uniref:D-alanine--D-alanine ligase n=1 Tax=Halalkalibaculum roseum TaxID=2709311 RepID=A0A6M1SRJ8_9BACT|nr:D-alanine--D-alanine ligase [Halalkalibaculum roseum]NGP75372.1 D-alanine--D-alanine ligase [Halalkalibaculum roseum]
MSQRTIVVAFGGMSPEHEVSVLTAMQAISSLKDTDYRLQPLYITKSGRWLTGDPLRELENYKDLKKLEEEAIECTFSHDDLGKPILLETESKGFLSKPKKHSIYAIIPAFHGSEGENGAFQGACDLYNIPFGGSGVFASSLGMDKVKAKELCMAHDIPVTSGVSFNENEWEERQDEILESITKMGFSVITKPVSLGSSIGVSKADDRKSLIDSIETAFRYDQELVVEEAITPLMEINCSVLGHGDELQTSVCERPLGQEETLSFEDKYQSDGQGSKGMASADRIIPADISDELTAKIQNLSLKIFKTFRASGVARLDFLVNADTHEVYFNEINTIPGSFSFYLWEESGMNMTDLMLELVEIAIKKHRLKIGRIRSYETNLLSEKAVKGIKGLKGSND